MIDKILKTARRLADGDAAGVPDRAEQKANYRELLDQVDDYFNPGRSKSLCKKCRAPLVWAETPAGRKAPLDAVAICGIDANGEVHTIHLNHFSTCPDADAVRAEKKAAGDVAKDVKAEAAGE